MLTSSLVTLGGYNLVLTSPDLPPYRPSFWQRELLQGRVGASGPNSRASQAGTNQGLHGWICHFQYGFLDIFTPVVCRTEFHTSDETRTGSLRPFRR